MISRLIPDIPFLNSLRFGNEKSLGVVGGVRIMASRRKATRQQNSSSNDSRSQAGKPFLLLSLVTEAGQAKTTDSPGTF